MRQYLAAGHVEAGSAAAACAGLHAGCAANELRLHVAPVVLGAGERLLEDVGDLRLEQLEVWSTRLVAHLRYRVA